MRFALRLLGLEHLLARLVDVQVVYRVHPSWLRVGWFGCTAAATALLARLLGLERALPAQGQGGSGCHSLIRLNLS